MRKLPLGLAAAVFLCLAASVASADVFLSELCDPNNNYQTDRFIEIYNSGPNAVALTNWRVVAIGNNVDVNTWTLSGSIGAGEAKVCGSSATTTVFPVHFPSANWLNATAYMNWNGKVGDGAKLIDNNNVILDQVVAPGVLFENADLVRVASVTTGSPRSPRRRGRGRRSRTARPARRPGRGSRCCCRSASRRRRPCRSSSCRRQR